MSKMPKEPKSITKKFLLITFIIYCILVQVLQRVSMDLLMKVTGAYLIIAFFGAFVLVMIHDKRESRYIEEVKKIEKEEREKELKEMEERIRIKNEEFFQEQKRLRSITPYIGGNSIINSLPTYYDDDEDEGTENYDEEEDEEEYVYVASGRGEVRYTLAEWKEELEEEERQRREEQEEDDIRAREEEERLRREAEEELNRQQEEEEYYWNYVRPALDEEYPDA